MPETRAGQIAASVALVGTLGSLVVAGQEGCLPSIGACYVQAPVNTAEGVSMAAFQKPFANIERAIEGQLPESGSPEGLQPNGDVVTIYPSEAGKPPVIDTYEAGKQPLFKTSGALPGAIDVIQRASILANPNHPAFIEACPGRTSDGVFKPNCTGYCLHLAAAVHEHRAEGGDFESGYDSAGLMMQAMRSQNKLHEGDRNPPIGALLFYDSGRPDGHVATYLGSNKGLSNDVLDATSGISGGAYIVELSEIESGAWSFRYIGWSIPDYGRLPATISAITAEELTTMQAQYGQAS